MAANYSMFYLFDRLVIACGGRLLHNLAGGRSRRARVSIILSNFVRCRAHPETCMPRRNFQSSTMFIFSPDRFIYS
jgi:hypothetical protein